MRAAGSKNCELAGSVVACTNARIACFAGPSFHEGSGSVWACTSAHTSRHKNATSSSLCIMVRCMCILLFPPSSVGAGAPRWGPTPLHHARRRWLIAPVTHVGFLDLLQDAAQIVGLGRLQRRELLVRQQVLQPQLLTDRQHVPVVQEGGSWAAERTANAEGRL